MVKARSNEMVATLLLGLLLLHFEVGQAAVFVVGGQSGWRFGVETWPYGKIFKAYDVVLFNYAPYEHNVVHTGSEKEYKDCLIGKDAEVYQTGQDRIILKAGPNYFFSAFNNECAAGLKFVIHTE